MSDVAERPAEVYRYLRYAELLRRALHETDDVTEAMLAAELALSLEPTDVALGMVGDEWHGPQPPGEGWVEVKRGPHGGKIWRKREGSPTNPDRTRPQAQPSPSAAPGSQAHESATQKPLSALHHTLATGRMKHAKKLNETTNDSFLLTLEDGTQGVFKPQSGEFDGIRSSVPDKTGYRREVAASHLAALLGFADMVPATAFRQQGEMGTGSMQQYIGEAPAAVDLDKGQRFDGPEDAARAAVFDYLLGNLDRHQGNWLVKNNKLVLIDNGTSLPVDYNDNTDYFNMEFWRHAVKHDMEVPDLSHWQGKWNECEEALTQSGIEDKAVELARQRFESLLRANASADRKIANLPGFFGEGWNLGKVVSTF